MGFEGANVIFDSWVHPLMMGLEEHLLAMFRDDVEFHDDAAPSHLGGKVQQLTPIVSELFREDAKPVVPEVEKGKDAPILVQWDERAEKELKKIPFFVRGKARRNTESFASARGVAMITIETLYDAKAHFSR
jgi:light-independent protochlorophyllide reductase subunit B